MYHVRRSTSDMIASRVYAARCIQVTWRFGLLDYINIKATINFGEIREAYLEKQIYAFEQTPSSNIYAEYVSCSFTAVPWYNRRHTARARERERDEVIKLESGKSGRTRYLERSLARCSSSGCRAKAESSTEGATRTDPPKSWVEKVYAYLRVRASVQQPGWLALLR